MKLRIAFTCFLLVAIGKTDALVEIYGEIDNFKYIGRALASPDDGFENYTTKIIIFPEVSNRLQYLFRMN